MKETVLIFVLLLLQWNVEAQNTLQKGEWRGVFTLKEGSEAPFNFELNEQSVILVNGEERFELRNYTFTNDSVLVPIEIYDAVLKAKVENSGKLSGHFIRLGSSDAGIPFYAEAGKSFRFFEDSQEAKVTLGGKWDFLIGSNKTIGVF